METECDPPWATRMMPIAAIEDASGTSAVSMKMRRARCRKTVVGGRCFTPRSVTDSGPSRLHHDLGRTRERSQTMPSRASIHST